MRAFLHHADAFSCCCYCNICILQYKKKVFEGESYNSHPRKFSYFSFNGDSDPDPAFYLNADPDLAFYLNADPDLAFYLNADPCGSGSRSLSDFKVSKSGIFTLKIYLKSVTSQKHTYEGAKAFLKGRKPCLLVNFCKFPCSWIRIHIPNTDPDPDPGQPNQCGIRIHNTAYMYCTK